jgi:hypothetical protein
MRGELFLFDFVRKQCAPAATGFASKRSQKNNISPEWWINQREDDLKKKSPIDKNPVFPWFSL